MNIEVKSIKTFGAIYERRVPQKIGSRSVRSTRILTLRFTGLELSMSDDITFKFSGSSRSSPGLFFVLNDNTNGCGISFQMLGLMNKHNRSYHIILCLLSVTMKPW